jgi:hypothetical protein
MDILSLFGDGEGILQVLWFFSFVIFMMFGSKLMITQTVWKLEKDIDDMEKLAEESRKKVEHSIELDSKRKRKLREFMDFFVVSPVSTDPYGLMKKIDVFMRQSDAKFTKFVNILAPDLEAVDKMNLKNALAGAMTTHQIAKTMRHMLETVKKYKMLQIAMILQMQIAMIKEMQKAADKATDAFILGTPIGDGIGPIVVASLIPKNARVNVDKENQCSYASVKIGKRQVLVAKASGPGATTGYPGRFLTQLVKEKRISKIITVDAALKMEGEKMGIVREGVGIAMGGNGADRYAIEEFAVKSGIPMDAIAIKMNQMQALQSMDKKLLNSVPTAIDKVKEILDDSKGKVLILGVGNTCGVPDSSKGLKECLDNVRKNSPKKPVKKKKRFGLF